MQRYHLLNSCLATLRSSVLPTVERLRLETHLLQLKRLLLHNEQEQPLRDAAEPEWVELAQLLQSLGGGVRGVDVQQVTDHILSIKRKMCHKAEHEQTALPVRTTKRGAERTTPPTGAKNGK